MDRRVVIKALIGGLVFPVVPIQIEAAAKKLDRRIYLLSFEVQMMVLILLFLIWTQFIKK